MSYRLKVLLAVLVCASATFAQSNSPPSEGSRNVTGLIADRSWQVVCSSDLGNTIRFAAEWREPAFFTDESLLEFFKTYARYPEKVEITITLSSDRDLVARLTDPRPIEFDAHEGPPPFEPPPLRAPIAFFYKVGRNASFQTSRPGQKVTTKTLSGSDPLAFSEAGLDVYYVGHEMPGGENCHNSRREVVLVVPGIDRASREQIVDIVRRCSAIYEYPFGALRLRIYRSFDEVAGHWGLLSLMAIEGGVNRKKGKVPPVVECWAHASLPQQTFSARM